MADRVTRSAARTATLAALPVALLAGLLVFWLMGGVGGGHEPADDKPPPGPQSTAPVAIAAPPLPERAAAVCRALLAELPGSVRELARRPVTAGPEQNAAYGDPAITLACGTPRPSFPPEEFLLGISRVCWYTDEQPDRSIWTTVDREIPVTVTVPKQYEGAGDWVNEFSGALAGTVPPAKTKPSGCT